MLKRRGPSLGGTVYKKSGWNLTYNEFNKLSFSCKMYRMQGNTLPIEQVVESVSKVDGGFNDPVV